MIVVVGLGNPGLRYKKTRHNIGFRVIDQFQKENNFSDFKFEKKFKADISRGAVGDKQVILVKPRTFMNSSGQAVKALLSFYKLHIQDLIVVHDDWDLPLGEFKVSQNRGSARHKGVQSIIDEMGSQDFTRLRLGISNVWESDSQTLGKEFVLQKFARDEQDIVKQTIKKTAIALATAVGDNIADTIN